jgi:DNA-directed RNA polymerase specialized sigma24 family protein
MDLATEIDKVQAALKALPPLTRRVVILVRYEQLGFAAAAARLQIRRRRCIRLYVRAAEQMKKAIA